MGIILLTELNVFEPPTVTALSDAIETPCGLSRTSCEVIITLLMATL